MSFWDDNLVLWAGQDEADHWLELWRFFPLREREPERLQEATEKEEQLDLRQGFAQAGTTASAERDVVGVGAVFALKIRF